MSRLIDADALIEELNNSHFPGAPYVDAGISIAIGKVLDAPTIEPKRKTGRWIEEQRGIKVTQYKCSECGRIVIDDTTYDVAEDYPFCHCGADMRGKQGG